MAGRVFEINKDKIELPRFTIDGEIDSTGVSMQRVHSLPCVSCRRMRERIRTQYRISWPV
jgi:hypothetical protein